MTFVAIALGGGIGACLRWVTVQLVPQAPSGFPRAITAVNVVGSFLLGLVIGAGWTTLGPVEADAATIGVLGGFTTFSTWMVDIERTSTPRDSLVVVFVPTILGLIGAASGLLVGGLLG